MKTVPASALKKQKTVVPLEEQVKLKVYDFINKFEAVVPVGLEFATWEQFKKAMFEFTKDEDDITNFWAKHNIDSKYYFSD